MGRDGLAQAAAFLVAQRLPRRFIHHDQPRRDDVPGQHQIFLHFEQLRALDRRQWIFLSVDQALAQGKIEFREIERGGACAPGFGHGAEGVDLRNPELEAFHVVDGIDGFRARCDVALSIVRRADHAHAAFVDELPVELVHQRRGEGVAQVLRVAPDIGRLENSELRHELAELCRTLVDELDRAGRRGLDHVAGGAKLTTGENLDFEGSAGLLLHLLGDALHHDDEWMGGGEHRGPANDTGGARRSRQACEAQHRGAGCNDTPACPEAILHGSSPPCVAAFGPRPPPLDLVAVLILVVSIMVSLGIKAGCRPTRRTSGDSAPAQRSARPRSVSAHRSWCEGSGRRVSAAADFHQANHDSATVGNKPGVSPLLESDVRRELAKDAMWSIERGSVAGVLSGPGCAAAGRNMSDGRACRRALLGRAIGQNLAAPHRLHVRFDTSSQRAQKLQLSKIFLSPMKPFARCRRGSRRPPRRTAAPPASSSRRPRAAHSAPRRCRSRPSGYR